MKFLQILLIILIACALGGVYGIIHDQITYSISPEYYTKFKFPQFYICGVAMECHPEPIRLYVGTIGLLATWWMGIPIGLIYGLISLRFKTRKEMTKYSIRAFGLTILVAFICAWVGLAFGYLYLVDQELNWYFPEELEDRTNFIAVGSMHNFSYLGGAIGLFIGSIFIVRKSNRVKNAA